MSDKTLPPLLPQAQFTIFEVNHEERSIIVAPISPNPGTDAEKQRDAMVMLAKTTGKDYAIMKTVANQEWGAATFDYVTGTLALN